jgi:hypothetical protein
MPKRILLPILLTTSVLSFGANTLTIATLPAYAQENNISIKDQPQQSSMRTITENFVGKRPRSDDFAFAKMLGIDTQNVEDAQSKVKIAEKSLKTEMQNIQGSIQKAIIAKATEMNVSSNIIDNYANTYQNLSETKKQLEDRLTNGDGSITSVQNLRIELKQNIQDFKNAETIIKDAIK